MMESKQMIANKQNPLTHNVKEFNIIFLIIIAIIIIGIAGATSFALFSSETTSTAKITGTVVSPKPTTGADTIIEKVGTGGLVSESHPATIQTSATTAYRYTGANPNNYVSFNNELWRIIGIFDTDDGTGNLEQRIKIIRNESIGSIAWDSANTNEWTKASGMTLLNSGDYWNRTGSYASIGLTEESKLMISAAKWYLGGITDYTTATNGLVSHLYEYERGKTVYDSTRQTSWTGKVGLMYPSDYGYATSGGTTTNRVSCLATELYNWNSSLVSDCKNNDWLYDSSNDQWTLTPYAKTSGGAFCAYSSGNIGENIFSVSTIALHPTTYLSPSIKITGGTGTQSDPYTLSK